MKDYLKEDIAFDKLIFSTIVTIVIIVGGGAIGSFINSSIEEKYKVIILATGLVLCIALILLGVLLYYEIKEKNFKTKRP